MFELCGKYQNFCKLKDFNWSFFLSLILKIVPIVLELIFGSDAKNYDDPYEDKMTCSDFITNDNYNIMIYQLRKAGQRIIFMFWFMYIFLGLNILFIILLFYIKWEKSNIDIYNGQKDKTSNNNKPLYCKEETNKGYNTLKKWNNNTQGKGKNSINDNLSERRNIKDKP